jgi:hypothetical protein
VIEMVSRLIVFLFALSLSSTVFAQVSEMPDSSAVTGVGKVFAITTSDYLNVTVESSNDIFAYIQSVPQQVTINVAKPQPEILSTTLTIRNLTPETSYTLIKNGSTEVIVSDDAGVYVCVLDLALPQKMQITTNQ